ncbi:hypothetical protein MUGA111182_19380 [Mucilaginibacter galii]
MLDNNIENIVMNIQIQNRSRSAQAQRAHLKRLARVRMKLTTVHLLIFALVVVLIFGAIMKSLTQ